MSDTLRAGFREIADGWMLIDDFDDLTYRIDCLAEWSKANAPLTAHELLTVQFMIDCQIARGIMRGDFDFLLP